MESEKGQRQLGLPRVLHPASGRLTQASYTSRVCSGKLTWNQNIGSSVKRCILNQTAFAVMTAFALIFTDKACLCWLCQLPPPLADWPAFVWCRG